MTNFGYTLMTEQSDPRSLVKYAASAEQLGYDLLVSSDHFSPWLTTQGHASHAWTMLGAVAQATSEIELMTYVTCPTIRYHPAIVAQSAATLGVLSEGRFTLGLGSGENLNEHTVGMGWPAVAQRQKMLVEAIEIIRELHTGKLVDYDGEFFQVDSARIWDLPDSPVELAAAVSGERSIGTFAPLVEHLIAVEPDETLVPAWNKVDGAKQIGSGGRAIGQMPICWGPDEEQAKAKAHDQFRWFAGGWAVNADLPTPAGFAGASQFVTPENVAEAIPCGPDLDAIVEAVLKFKEVGFTDVAIVQVGDEGQQEFLDTAAGPLLEKLRAAS